MKLFYSISYSRTEADKKNPQLKQIPDHKSSISKSIADPRTVRIQRILSSGVLNLQLEKHLLYNTLPTDPYDFYIQSLRASTSKVRQVGVPMDVEHCDMEINTEEITLQDKEVQHCFEDDMAFFQMLDTFEKKNKNKGDSLSWIKEAKQSSPFSNHDFETDENDSLKVNKLTNFLQNTVSVFETVFRERFTKNDQSEAITRYRSSQETLFSNETSWVAYGKGFKHGSNELLCTRTYSSVVFSVLQSYLFLITHPVPIGDALDLDLRPQKVSFCFIQYS